MIPLSSEHHMKGDKNVDEKPFCRAVVRFADMLNALTLWRDRALLRSQDGWLSGTGSPDLLADSPSIGTD
jgi:hypothetical protein